MTAECECEEVVPRQQQEEELHTKRLLWFCVNTNLLIIEYE